MPLCLFCPSELDESTKPEHILLNALGGRMTTKHAICSACNNRFGGTIDDELASQVMTLRNFLQLESGTGNPAPTLKNVQAGAHKINIRGDGQLELVDKPFTIKELGDGRWNIQIKVRSEEEFKRIVPHIAAKTKIPEDRLREQLAGAQASIISQRPGAIGHSFSFGGPQAIRSVVKSSLVLWSSLTGNDEIRSEPYDAARRFVVQGDKQFNIERTHLDSRYYQEVEEMKAGFGLMFNLLYVRSDDTGRVVGHFTLYNAIAWQFTLAEAGGTPNAKIGLISNPLDPGQWSGRAAEQFDISMEWLSNPDYCDEMVRSKARLEALVKHYFESNRNKPILRIIEDCFKTLGLVPDQIVPADKLQDLIKLVSYRVSHHALGLPYEERLTAEQLAALLK